jgi:hypothetical protein
MTDLAWRSGLGTDNEDRNRDGRVRRADLYIRIGGIYLCIHYTWYIRNSLPLYEANISDPPKKKGEGGGEDFDSSCLEARY